MAKSPPTIRDVARAVGVSHQTVSRVVNNNPHVSPETRERVMKAILDLGYHPNAIAQSMAHGRSCMLAFVAPNLVDFTFASNQEGAEFEARKSGYFLITSSASNEEDFEELVDELIARRRVDGIVVFNPHLDCRQTLQSRGIPLVYCVGSARDDIRYSIFLDNREAANVAARHLLNLGHTRIGEITGPLIEDCAQERHKGFMDALSGMVVDASELLSKEGDWSATSGYKIFQYWEQNGELPTAIIAQNDRMAIGVIRAARDAGIRVPEGLSVVGFDDMPLASYFDPPLTTIRQDTFMLGREAVRLLLMVINDPALPPQHFQYSCELVIRKSTAKLERR
jgi:DNA-binding LacI/PurR family transcriptional regulator